MSFSVQQIYRRSVIILCLALCWLLLIQISLFSLFHLRDDHQRNLHMQGAMIASQLMTSGGRNALSYLGTAKVNTNLVVACVVRDGRVSAAVEGLAYRTAKNWMEKNPGETCSRLYEAERLGFRLVAVKTPIAAAHLPKATGEVFTVSSLPAISKHFGARLLSFGGILIIFVILCTWLGNQLRKTVLRPIRQIASTAQRVTLYKDYSLRITTGALATVPKEIDLLIESLNAMLKEIEDRDSRLMRKTSELEKARESAETANVAKSQFLANISHELRTPLNAIIGFSTMLRDQQYGPLGSEKYNEYARDIQDSGKHLLDIINDILDLSRAEAGKLSVKFEALALHKIIEKALHIVAGQAQQGKIDIYTDIPEKLPKIVADRVRVTQILLNLLSNAIKFTGEGGRIVVRVHCEPGKAGVHFFTIDVEDNGIGMTESEIANAFTTFNQADAGLNRRYEGAGLGLPLTKRLVELHHGKIKIESRKGEGTRVSVRLTSDPALLD